MENEEKNIFMPKLAEQGVKDYNALLKKWQDNTNALNMYIIGVMAAVEVIFMFVLNAAGEIPSIPYYILRFIAAPIVLNIVLYAVTWWIGRSKKIHGTLKSIMPLVMFTLLMMNIICTHYIFPAMYALVVMPMFMSVIFGNPRMTRLVFLLSEGMFLVAAVIIYVINRDDLPERFFLQIILVLLILPFVYVIVKSIVQYEMEKGEILRKQGTENEKLQEEVLYDALTMIYNFNALKRLLPEAVKKVSDPSRLHLAILDVDFFKQVNDDFGHDAGNVVLSNLGKILSEIGSSQVMVARYGGEEFAMVFMDMPLSNANLVLNDVFQRFLTSSYPNTGIDRAITFSAGLATYEAGMDTEAFFKKADAALYRAKENGRRQIIVAASGQGK